MLLCDSNVVLTKRLIRQQFFMKRKRPVWFSITHKWGQLIHSRLDFARGGLEGGFQGALATALRRSFSISL